MSSRFDRFVVPTIGAVTPGFARIHAIEICAMLTPFFFASSSTLPHACQRACVCTRMSGGVHLPPDEVREEADVERLEESTGGRVSQRCASVAMGCVRSTYASDLLRSVSVLSECVSSPRPSGDQGIEPTPNICTCAQGR